MIKQEKTNRSHMFNDIQKNFTIVEGAYKKIKIFYFYSKDKLFERLKISDFESDKQLML